MAQPYAQCREQARIAADRYGLPPDLIWALAVQESGCRINISNASGAKGIVQIIEKFHPQAAPVDIDPKKDLDYCAKTIAEYYRSINSYALAVAAWHSGLSRLRKYAPCLPPRQPQFFDGIIYTADYAIAIMRRADLKMDASDCYQSRPDTPPKEEPRPIPAETVGGEYIFEGSGAMLQKYLVLGVAALLIFLAFSRLK
ncbi:MAG TPA: transglycosylase SLT domain-containing protein [Gammaproteobacteria bacterium]|nr:transglycosylase SLT domain-containing protein [Gammaproteobacteria bacterium]